ncbi:hypothetical protein K443DRAFT_593796 [Laccaria amethystina LaAM-08-1]|uniref:Uncharacterized protein n=1 Tax=Laccaria amethystina LaAM-08-1 TaxID=1095629 RepID=A0A0C9XH19_9AGAR|nr:hypothetical protein K443DRAFT_593796 [Laccaria amethystina LaAM-08-1]
MPRPSLSLNFELKGWAPKGFEQFKRGNLNVPSHDDSAQKPFVHHVDGPGVCFHSLWAGSLTAERRSFAAGRKGLMKTWHETSQSTIAKVKSQS